MRDRSKSGGCLSKKEREIVRVVFNGQIENCLMGE